MSSFLSSAGRKFMDALRGIGYFDRSEISEINAKYTPGLELHFASEYARTQKYNSDHIDSRAYNKEVGMLYKLKYGEICAKFVCQSNPLAELSGTLRVFDRLAGFKLSSMGVVDISSHKLNEWTVGFEAIAGNGSAQMKINTDRYVFLARHRIHPRFVALTVFNRPFMKPEYKSTLALGFEWEFHSRTSLEVMFCKLHPATFALQYQFSRPHQCLVRVSGDVYSSKIGVSCAFHPSSVF